MCGRYSLAPDQSKEIAQIVAEVEAWFGAANIHTGEIFPTNAAPTLLPDGQTMAPKPMVWGSPVSRARGRLSMCVLKYRWINRYFANPCRSEDT